MRKYMPTFAELLDRMYICRLKEIFISENAEEYKKEINDIKHDLKEIIEEKNIKLTPELLEHCGTIMLSNRYIWENESKARSGESQDLTLLLKTHSINGVRNTAKNFISKIIGERLDLKIDCLAADLPKEMGNWNIFTKE